MILLSLLLIAGIGAGGGISSTWGEGIGKKSASVVTEETITVVSSTGSIIETDEVTVDSETWKAVIVLDGSADVILNNDDYESAPLLFAVGAGGNGGLGGASGICGGGGGGGGVYGLELNTLTWDVGVSATLVAGLSDTTLLTEDFAVDILVRRGSNGGDNFGLPINALSSTITGMTAWSASLESGAAGGGVGGGSGSSPGGLGANGGGNGGDRAFGNALGNGGGAVEGINGNRFQPPTFNGFGATAANLFSRAGDAKWDKILALLQSEGIGTTQLFCGSGGGPGNSGAPVQGGSGAGFGGGSTNFPQDGNILVNESFGCGGGGEGIFASSTSGGVGGKGLAVLAWRIQ